jgi:MerR family transcriptional regulator, copper efflux regulator
VAFAARLDADPALRDTIAGWLREEAQRPDDVPADDWLRFEQDKHERLLQAAV